MNRQIECMARLMAIDGSLDDVVDFLIEEKIIDASVLPYYKREPNKPLFLWTLISNAKEKVMLFDFEWSILPIERIKITIVTNSTSKTFGHRYV